MRPSARHLTSPADRIPMFQGRPIRQESITKDDVLNLIIALELHADIAEICADKHLFDSSR